MLRLQIALLLLIAPQLSCSGSGQFDQLEDPGIAYVASKDGIPLRTEASDGSDTIRLIPYNARLRKLENTKHTPRGHWSNVSYQGHRGWVLSASLADFRAIDLVGERASTPMNISNAMRASHIEIRFADLESFAGYCHTETVSGTLWGKWKLFHSDFVTLSGTSNLLMCPDARQLEREFVPCTEVNRPLSGYIRVRSGTPHIRIQDFVQMTPDGFVEWSPPNPCWP